MFWPGGDYGQTYEDINAALEDAGFTSAPSSPGTTEQAKDSLRLTTVAREPGSMYGSDPR